jgi:hypothetical protein
VERDEMEWKGERSGKFGRGDGGGGNVIRVFPLSL